MTAGRIAQISGGGIRSFSVPALLSHNGFPWSYITWGMNNRPVCGRSSERSYHPIYVIIIIIIIIIKQS
jgi:hypothetical protein